MHEVGMQASGLFGCYRLECAVHHEVANALAPICQLRTAGGSCDGNPVSIVDRQFIRMKVPVCAYQQDDAR
jgi:hypothetical protein